jgi:ABC-2 type transport system ATP-binding protein
MSDSQVIRVEGLTKRYPEVVAVDRIDFSVAQGEVVGFLGPNGAGKTTTLKMLTCFMPATEGRAEINGFDINNQSLQVRRSIGYLPENNALYEEMRVREYLRFRAALKRVPWSKRRRNVDEAIERCNLGDMVGRTIGRLSKGYRQRVGLADTLVSRPPVLIFDEPTVGLDPRQIVEVRELIKELGRENTILLSTHYLPEVEQICDRVMVIHRGRLVLDERLAELKQAADGTTRSLEEVFIEVTGEPAEGLADELPRRAATARDARPDARDDEDEPEDDEDKPEKEAGGGKADGGKAGGGKDDRGGDGDAGDGDVDDEGDGDSGDGGDEDGGAERADAKQDDGAKKGER